MAKSRGPEPLKDLGAKTGAIPVSLEEVVPDVDVLFLVVPQKAQARGDLREAPRRGRLA